MTFPESVEDIGANAFTGNTFSSHVYIPNESATVDATAFESSTTVVKEGTDDCFEIANNVLSAYYCGRDVTVPDGVTSINANTFENKGLTAVSFPESLVDIGANAFTGNSFSLVYIPNESAIVDATAFDQSAIVVIEGTDSCFEISNDVLSAYYCTTQEITIPEGVTHITANTFEDKGLTSVTFSESVIDIGANAFTGNSFSSLVYIPNESAIVDATAFDQSVMVVIEGTDSCFEILNNALSDYYCMSQEVTIPEGVTHIAANAFEDKDITSVTFPESVIDIGANAFTGNTFSSYVYIPNESATVDDTAFESSTTVVKEGTDDCFEIANNVLSAYYCGRDVTVPDGVTSIDANTFENKGLTAVSFPESLVAIGANAFTGNSFSSLVYIPNESAIVDATAFDQSAIVVIEGTDSCFEILNNVSFCLLLYDSRDNHS